MFLWKTRDILGEIERHLPELHKSLEKIDKRLDSEDLESILQSVYPEVPSVSIDYGVMEKSENVAVLRAGFQWNDVGSWEYIRDIQPHDQSGNAAMGNHVFIDSSENTVFSPERLVGFLGVDDLVVVDSSNAILICKRDRVQDVREIVKQLAKQGKDEYY